MQRSRTPHKAVPLLAAAEQEGKAAPVNIHRLLNQRTPLSFRYRNLGNLVSIGRGIGVANIGGVLIEGFAGWLIWRFIHLIKIRRFRNKLATTMDWASVLTYDVDTARLEFDVPKKAA